MWGAGDAQPAREEIFKLKSDADWCRDKSWIRELDLRPTSARITLCNIAIYRILFPPQLVSPAVEPLKRNPTPCHKF